MKNYTTVASKWRQENKGLKRNVWTDASAFNRCVALGLFQGKTENEPHVSTARGKRRVAGHKATR